MKSIQLKYSTFVKYAIVLVSFMFFFMLFSNVQRCLASFFIDYDKSFVTIDKENKRIDFGYRAPYWYIPTDLEIEICPNDGTECLTFFKDNPKNVSNESIFRFYNDGTYDYLINVSFMTTPTYSEKQTSDIKGFADMQLGFKLSYKWKKYKLIGGTSAGKQDTKDVY